MMILFVQDVEASVAKKESISKKFLLKILFIADLHNGKFKWVITTYSLEMLETINMF